MGDIEQLVGLLEDQLNRKGLFDYNAILNSTVGALKLALAEKILTNENREETLKRRKNGIVFLTSCCDGLTSTEINSTEAVEREDDEQGLYWPKELTSEGIGSVASMAITPSGFDDTLEDEYNPQPPCRQ